MTRAEFEAKLALIGSERFGNNGRTDEPSKKRPNRSANRSVVLLALSVADGSW